ncbi:MAG: hypothetical protein CBB97_15090 [Candidatus Endolissoclinum sp. TMED37]|nr:MAG: hypothetical protein CBB97_15090 [Candidatus Endolissoclinum sp. TMED37]
MQKIISFPKIFSMNNSNSIKNALIYSYKLLNRKEKKQLKFNVILSFIAGIFEIISVTTFYPLVSVVIEPEIIETNKFINNIWNYLNNPEQGRFVIFLAFIASIILIFSILLNLVSQVLAKRDASSAEERLAKEIYSNLIYSSYRWHLLNNPNLTRNIILSNLNLWNRGIVSIIPSIAGQLAGIIFAIITLLLTTPKLGLILLVLSGSLLLFLLRFVRRKSNKLMNRIRQKQEFINVFLTESLTGIKDIKLSSNENYIIKTFFSVNHVIIKYFASASNWNSLPSFLVILFGQLSILITASSFFIMGIRGGELAAIMTIIGLVFIRIIPLFNRLGSSLTNISNYSGFVERVFELVNSIKESDSEIEKCLRDKSNESILNWENVIFSSVTFSYPNSQKPVIKNLNCKIKKGLNYAFVGSSGAGKSTTIDLFLGLLKPTKGKIMIDGKDLQNIGIGNWQKNINYVPQEPLISDLTLRENVAFGISKESINDERVLYCLKQTHLLKVTRTLKKGIYTELGNKGINLSGGQKQRVAIARALYRNADILVLDEATSSLDSQTEKMIQKTILSLKSKITFISIAHRFSTIKNCDCIFLLNNGKVVNKGKFEDLEKNSPLFRQLASSQISQNK